MSPQFCCPQMFHAISSMTFNFNICHPCSKFIFTKEIPKSSDLQSFAFAFATSRGSPNGSAHTSPQPSHQACAADGLGVDRDGDSDEMDHETENSRNVKRPRKSNHKKTSLPHPAEVKRSQMIASNHQKEMDLERDSIQKYQIHMF